MCNLDLEAKVAKKFLALQQSARDRGIEFKLSLTALKALYKAKRCFYTAQKLTTHDSKLPTHLTIDRVDNTKGYIIGNVVACSLSFNFKKGSMELGDMSLIVKKAQSKGIQF